MADTKTMITDISLDAAVNLNKVRTDIKPWQSWLKQNSPIYGGVISPLNRRVIAMSGKPWVSDTDGNIYSASVSGDVCTIKRGDDVITEVAAKGVDAEVIAASDWDSIKVIPVSGGDKIGMVKLVDSAGTVTYQTITGSARTVTTTTLTLSLTGHSVTIYPKAVRLSGDEFYIIAYFDTTDYMAYKGTSSRPSGTGTYTIAIFTVAGAIAYAGAAVGAMSTYVISDMAVANTRYGDYVKNNYVRDPGETTDSWSSGTNLTTGSATTAETTGTMIQWTAQDAPSTTTRTSSNIVFISSTNSHTDFFIKLQSGTRPGTINLLTISSETSAIIPLQNTISTYSSSVPSPIIQYAKYISPAAAYIGGVGGTLHRVLLYDTDTWQAPTNITIITDNFYSHMFTSITINQTSFSVTWIAARSDKPLTTPYDDTVVPPGIQQCCSPAVSIMTSCDYSSSYVYPNKWTMTSSPCDGLTGYANSGGTTGPGIWTRSDTKGIDTTYYNDCVTTFIVGGNIFRLHTLYDQLVSIGIGTGVALSAYGEIDSEESPELGYTTVLYKTSQGAYQHITVTSSPERRLKRIADNMIQINTISVNNVIETNSGKVFPGSVDYLPTILGFSYTYKATEDTTISQLSWGSAVNPNYTSGKNIVTAGACLPAVELRYTTRTPLSDVIVHPSYKQPDYTASALSGCLSDPEKSQTYQVENYLKVGSTTATYYTPDYNSTLEVNNQSVDAIFTDESRSGLVYPQITSSSIFMTPPLISEYAYSTGNDSVFSVGDYLAGSLLTYNNQQVLLYNAAGTAFVIPGSTLFRLFGQLYMFDAKNIYACTESDGSVTGYTKIVNALGLTLCGVTTRQVYMWSAVDRSFWVFDGSRNLTRLTSANAISSVLAAAYCITDNQTYIATDTGLLVIRDGGMSVYPDISVPAVYATTAGPVIQTSDGNCVKFFMEASSDTAAQQIDIQTAYMGSGSGMMSQNDCLYVRLFDPLKGNGKLTITQNTLTDTGVQSTTVTKAITAAMWDSLTQTYLVRHQPQFQKSAGVSFRLQSDFAIQSLAIGHTDYAKVATGPQGGM